MMKNNDERIESYDLPTFPLRPGEKTIHSFKFAKTYRLTDLMNIPVGIVVDRVEIGRLPKVPVHSWSRAACVERLYRNARVLCDAGESLYIYVRNDSTDECYTGGKMVLLHDEVPGAPERLPPRFDEDEGTSEFAKKIRELIAKSGDK